jgi:ribonucleoside-diphosphate reductase alpha chain
MSKQGSTLAGVMDAFSIAISIGLHYGVPPEPFVSKYMNMRFEPAGMTDDPDVRMAQSVMDHVQPPEAGPPLLRAGAETASSSQAPSRRVGEVRCSMRTLPSSAHSSAIAQRATRDTPAAFLAATV